MLRNVEIVVEDEPRPDQWEGDDDPDLLFGLYEGTPLTERSSGWGLVLPDKITIFRGPLERSFPNQAELVRQIQVTVVHEVGHHFGMDEERLEELGWG